jgi:hypothetical protein
LLLGGPPQVNVFFELSESLFGERELEETQSEMNISSEAPDSAFQTRYYLNYDKISEKGVIFMAKFVDIFLIPVPKKIKRPT